MKSFVITSALLLTLVLASVTVAEAQARKVLQPTELLQRQPTHDHRNVRGCRPGGRRFEPHSRSVRERISPVAWYQG